MSRRVLAALVIVLAIAACTPGPNPVLGTPDAQGDIAGFWMGLWHGLIAPVTFVISLFSESVQPYDVHNNGGWYDLGFLFGLSCVFGGGGSGAARRTRRPA